MKIEEKYMFRCLQLAKIAEGYVSPNPMVGAVLVHEDKIVGEGFHHRYGESHAEPYAINSVKDKDVLKNSTLYVNLEPCSHYGNTPPCANLIVRSGIPRVVVGTHDPNPKVSGKGVKILLDAGIEVETGVLEKENRELNKRFFVFHEKKRPYVFLKWAQTQDGFIDIKRKDNTVLPLQISNTITRQLTHKIRSENQSILIGSNTVMLDNPSLTVRNWSGKSPVRIILNRLGNIPVGYNVMDQKVQTIIFTANPKPNTQKIEYVKADFETVHPAYILQQIYARNIHSVLVEGGAKLLNSFICLGLWDEAQVEVSDQLIGNGIAAPNINNLPCDFKIIENHKYLYYKNLCGFNLTNHQLK
ncbi:MAG: bifunctional diaminohydroxyphosphoribosylaminopyrimidine deaminase/5-amino-6-(5-phosphoribosylamino)uracil reductase RibD [Paludibacter sp.]|nr:bifunctional diaminohydroxyphosphoribosylaminopyrimidine deaminase/5-amino-6-(5-phosphoribosylamino)uracil reductase RibD [Paludibacter sp.]